MRKKYIIVFIALILIITFFISIIILDNYSFTGYIIKDNYIYTKAICNESNFCQDYIIYCEGDKLIEKIPIKGAIVKHSENWKDPRGKENSNNLCKS